VESCAR